MTSDRISDDIPPLNDNFEYSYPDSYPLSYQLSLPQLDDC